MSHRETDPLLLSMGRERRYEHDPLCPIPRGVGPTGCHCDLIAQVGERIAQAIEAHRNVVYANNYPAIYVEDAARIARNGGRND